MRRIHALLILAFVTGTASTAFAVSLSEIIRNCRADGKIYCPNTSNGKPMQQCLTLHRSEISVGCKGIVDRLNSGEKFSFF